MIPTTATTLFMGLAFVMILEVICVYFTNSFLLNALTASCGGNLGNHPVIPTERAQKDGVVDIDKRLFLSLVLEQLCERKATLASRVA